MLVSGLPIALYSTSLRLKIRGLNRMYCVKGAIPAVLQFLFKMAGIMCANGREGQAHTDLSLAIPLKLVWRGTFMYLHFRPSPAALFHFQCIPPAKTKMHGKRLGDGRPRESASGASTEALRGARELSLLFEKSSRVGYDILIGFWILCYSFRTRG